jgi:hypothetical protein
MTEHAVVVAGGGPTVLMLAGELALAGVDVAIVERRASEALPGSRAGGLSARTIEVFDQRGIADRFLAEGQPAQVIQKTSPASLLDTYHAERYPVGARAIRNAMAASTLRRPDDRTTALRETIAELLSMDGPRKRFAATLSGLGVHYDLGDGHPLLGRRMPDLDLVTADGPLRVFALLHGARPTLLNLGDTGRVDITGWDGRVQLIDATYDGARELPALGEVAAPTAVLIRPDGYVAWVGRVADLGLVDALTTWFGAPDQAQAGPQLG